MPSDSRSDAHSNPHLPRREAEAEHARLQIKRSQEHAWSQAVLDQMPSGVVMAAAPGGKLLLQNQEATRLLRHPLRDAPEIAAYTGYGAIHPDGTPYLPEEYPLARALLQEEPVRQEEIRYRRGDGTLTTLSVSASPVRDGQGNVVAAVCAFHDIADRKRREDMLAFLGEASRVLSSSLDYEAVLHDLAALTVPRIADLWLLDLVEPGGTRRIAIAHADPGKEDRLREYSRRYPPGRLDEESPAAVALRTGVGVFVPEAPLGGVAGPALDADQAELIRAVGPGSVLAVPLLARGQLLGALTLARTDESGRRFDPEDLPLVEELAHRTATAIDHARAYRLAVTAQAEAEAANRAKGEFLAATSHELRTPLNAILGYTELLELGIAGPVTPQQLDYHGRIRLSAQHLLGLMNEILDLAKMEAGRMTVRERPGHVASVVSDALLFVRPQAVARRIALSDAAYPPPDLSYLGDEDRVLQILINLLSNALKFTDPGGAVSIGYRLTRTGELGARLPGEGPWACIRVTDTGIGIPPEKLETIFEPFVQVEGTPGSGLGGTGLGLAISRRFARLMNGDLTVESRVGQGSTFTLWLPVPRVHSPPSPLEVDRASTAEAVARSEVSRFLVASVPGIVRSFVDRLRSDPRIPASRGVSRTDLEDHVAAFLADFAQGLAILDASDSDRVSLFREGTRIQRMLAEMHGRQRGRLGWGEEELRREFEVLRSEIESALRRGMVEMPLGETEDLLALVRLLLHEMAEVSVSALLSASPGVE